MDIQSKWVSEQIMGKAQRDGRKVTIVRPSFIVGSTKTGICNSDDFVWKLVKACVILNKVPKLGSIELDMTPVDKVSEVSIKLFENDIKVSNLYPEQKTDLSNLLKEFNVEEVTKEEWMLSFMEKVKEGNPEFMTLIGSLGMFTGDRKLISHKESLENNKLDKELNQPKELIDKSIETLKKSGFFGEKYGKGRKRNNSLLFFYRAGCQAR